MPFNITNLTEGTSFSVLNLFQWSNEVTLGWFGISFVILVFIIPFITMLNFGAKRAFAGASFALALIATPMRLLNLIPDMALYFSFILVGGAVVWLIADPS